MQSTLKVMESSLRGSFWVFILYDVSEEIRLDELRRILGAASAPLDWRENEIFVRKQGLATARASIPRQVELAQRLQNNVIVRLYQPRPVLPIQLDDFSEIALERLRAVAFMILQTSPANHRAWIAVQGQDG